MSGGQLNAVRDPCGLARYSQITVALATQRLYSDALKPMTTRPAILDDVPHQALDVASVSEHADFVTVTVRRIVLTLSMSGRRRSLC
jgi:hypothetical protein